MDGESPTKLLVIQEDGFQSPSDETVAQRHKVPPEESVSDASVQPITCQMPHGQQQPILIEVSVCQPVRKKPIQCDYGSFFDQVEPSQSDQLRQPLFDQHAPGQPVQPQQQRRKGNESPAQPSVVQKPHPSVQPVTTQSQQTPAKKPAVDDPRKPVKRARREPQVGKLAQRASLIFKPKKSRRKAGEPAERKREPIEVTIDKDFVKSPLFFIKIAEFVTLLAAWASIVMYLEIFKVPFLKKFQFNEDDNAEYFKRTMILAWVVVTIYLIIYIINSPKLCACHKPSICIRMFACFHFFLLILMAACTGNLAPRVVELAEISTEWFKSHPERVKLESMPHIIGLYVALGCGLFSCILFVLDIALSYRLFQSQLAHERTQGAHQETQEPPQRQVLDINFEYLRSPVFYVKLVEIVLLLGAWVCILIYFDVGDPHKSLFSPFDREKENMKTKAISTSNDKEEDSFKQDFFKVITIVAWVMVIFLALIFVFSVDKLCSRSSPWSLMTLIIYCIMSILLIACCGYLTPLAVEYFKEYEDKEPEKKRKFLALFIGLGMGHIAWITFIVDICLICKLYRKQRAQESIALVTAE